MFRNSCAQLTLPIRVTEDGSVRLAARCVVTQRQAKPDECPRSTIVEHLGERHFDRSRDSRALVGEPQLTQRRVRPQRANDVEQPRLSKVISLQIQNLYAPACISVERSCQCRGGCIGEREARKVDHRDVRVADEQRQGSHLTWFRPADELLLQRG